MVVAAGLGPGHVELMRVLEQHGIPANTGRAATVRQGCFVRVSGRTTADFVAFNLNDLRERFDQARTKTNQNTIYVTTGHVLYSKLNHPMLTIVEDTYVDGQHQHNLEKGMCSRARHELAFRQGLMKASYGREIDLQGIPDHGCFENLTEALRPWGIAPEDIPSPFNIFQTLEIDPASGRMTNTTLRPRQGAQVTMRAEMDLLVAVSACPDITVGGQDLTLTLLDPDTDRSADARLDASGHAAEEVAR